MIQRRVHLCGLIPMGIHPIDAVVQHRQEFGADGAPVLDEIAVGDGDAVDDVALGFDDVAVEDDANLTLAQSIHTPSAAPTCRHRSAGSWSW